MSADPITLGLGGAVLGGMMDKENPLRGAALGGIGGAVGGPLFNAAEPAAAGMSGALGSGINPAATVGLNASAGGLSPMALAGGATPVTQAGGGMAALGAEGGGLMGNVASAAPSSGLLGKDAAMQALKMGGNLMAGGKEQPQPVPMAPAQMQPRPQAAPFLASAPSFHPMFGMGQNRNVAPNRRG